MPSASRSSVEALERASTPRRRWPVRVSLVVFATLLALAVWAGLSIAGLAPAFPWSRTVATWDLPATSDPDPATTSLTILVSRIECNSGETGRVKAPRVAEGADSIVITAYVTPSTAQSGTCVGNDQVPLDVRLEQPLGSRTLVDGACAGPAAEYAMCVNEVRWPRPAR